MEPAAYQREVDLNRTAYETLRDQIRRDCAGKYVALAHGRLITTSTDFDSAVAAVQRLQPTPEIFFVFPAEMEPHFDLGYDVSEFRVR